MNFLSILNMTAAVLGLVLWLTILVYRRFGAVWSLALFLIPGSIAAGALGIASLVGMSPYETAFLTFQFLLLCGTGSCVTSYVLEREDYAEQFHTHRWFFAVLAASGPCLALALYLFRPTGWDAVQGSEAVIALGPVGYVSGLYLLVVSVIALANFEQTVRSAPEHVLWEIKFLMLGLAVSCAALIYVAAQILVYPPAYSYISLEAEGVFAIIFFCSNLLIMESWRRRTGRERIVVAQSAVYSTVTSVAVGGYLVGIGLIARWTSQWDHPGIRIEAVVVLLSLIALGLTILTTSFRHRARAWLRRNVFTGKYDYRQSWMDATERVRSIGSPEVAAREMAALLAEVIGTLDVSVWLRVRNRSTMRLVATRGAISGQLPSEVTGMVNAIDSDTEPIVVSECLERFDGLEPSNMLTATKTSVLVPLVSSGRLIGALTVGQDRTGRPFDRETRDFLRVTSVHLANEFHKAELMSILVEARQAEALQTFSTFLLHDLKNFASTLSMIAGNGQRHHGSPEFQRDAFQSVLNISGKMKNVCNSLGTFSTTLAAHKTCADINAIVESVVTTFQSDTGRNLRLDLAQVPEVEVDSEEIARVLQNLILNAHEASYEAGTVTIATRTDTRGIVLSVVDEGRGMKQEYLERSLCQPFQTTKKDGMGVGLFQSKKIVEAHDGVMEIESEEGHGTVVRIILPSPRGVFFDGSKLQERTTALSSGAKEELVRFESR